MKKSQAQTLYNLFRIPENWYKAFPTKSLWSVLDEMAMVKYSYASVKVWIFQDGSVLKEDLTTSETKIL